MTCKVRRDFKIITDVLSRVSRQFHWWHRTFGDLRLSPKYLYKKTSQEILAELKAVVKTGALKVPRLRPVLHSLLWQACVNSQLSPTPPSPPRGREQKNVTKMNFSSCNDHSPKWIINDCYIFFPYLRVSVFLFLWTYFLRVQHVGPMLHMLQGFGLGGCICQKRYVIGVTPSGPIILKRKLIIHSRRVNLDYVEK